MRSRFVASRKLPLEIAGPFWAALASVEGRLPSRLAAAVLTLFPHAAEMAPMSRAQTDTASLRRLFLCCQRLWVKGLPSCAVLHPCPFVMRIVICMARGICKAAELSWLLTDQNLAMQGSTSGRGIRRCVRESCSLTGRIMAASCRRTAGVQPGQRSCSGCLFTALGATCQHAGEYVLVSSCAISVTRGTVSGTIAPA